jgi:hypothetical protein
MNEESHYQESSGLLALEIYTEDSFHTEREAWTERAVSGFRELVAANKNTLVHVELADWPNRHPSQHIWVVERNCESRVPLQPMRAHILDL